MSRYFKIFIMICLVACAAAPIGLAAEKKFEVSLDKSRVALGDRAQLGLSFYGTQSMPAPDLGNIDGLEIRYLGPSTMMTVINGQVSSSITHMYAVLPLKLGKFQLGPFTFKYKGDNYTSNMVFLEAAEERMAPRTAQQQAAQPMPAEQMDLGDRIFVVLNVNKASAYVNELIPVTVKLYVNRLNVSDIQLPTFEQEGFSKIEFREPKQYKENFRGAIYDVLEFKTSIFGTKPGDYRLGPARVKCNVMVRKNMPRSSMKDDFFRDDYQDPLFDDFFTRYERYPMELKSQDTQITVLPIPASGRPQDFTGAIGDYQFIFNASPTKLKVGDPITLRMDINGTGNFNTVLIPKLENMTGFKVYEPQVKTEENRKSFTQVLIPESDLVTQIPKAVFTYFDPNKSEYKNITQGPIAIQVEKGKEEAPSQVIGPMAVPGAQALSKDEELARDIIYIKDSPGKWHRKGAALYKSGLFYGLALIPLIFLPSLYIFQRRRTRLKTDTVYAGRLAAFRSARKHFKGLKNQLKSGDSEVFYETLFKTLQDYLGYRLQLPSAGMTFGVAESVLISKDADRDILRKIRGLFDVCDRAKFASFKVEDFKMADDLKEMEEVIKYLERKKI